MKKHLLSLTFCLVGGWAHAQETMTEIYFDSNSTAISPTARQLLSSVVAHLKATAGSHEIIITGYADASGSPAYNDSLSLLRALAVEQFLEARGVEELMVVEHRGENELAYQGAAIHRNRRVTITRQAPRAADGMAELLPPKQAFIVSPHRDTVLVARYGTRLTIPQGSFITSSDAPISVTLIECYQLSEMLMAQLTTYGSDGRLLTSKGMVHIEATQDGVPVQLADTGLGLVFPTRQTGDGTALYYADAAGAAMRWETAPPQDQQPLNYSPPPTPADTLWLLNSNGPGINIFMVTAGIDSGAMYWTDGYTLAAASLRLQVLLIEKYEALYGAIPDFDGSGFNVRRLGWLNCDYYLRRGMQTLPMAVQVVSGPATPNLMLIPAEQKSIMPYGSREGNRFEWQMPEGERVTLVGFAPGPEPDTYYFVKRRIVTRSDTLNIAMQVVSKDELRQFLNQI